jgi:hypothetical protein
MKKRGLRNISLCSRKYSEEISKIMGYIATDVPDINTQHSA